MDLTDGIFWVGRPPNQLGKFVAFDVNDFDHELPNLAVSADEMLASGEFERAKAARKELGTGEKALRNRDWDAALKAADQAEKDNPGFYQNAWLRGRALLVQGRNAEAMAAFESALAEQPAFKSERTAIEEMLERAQGKQ